MMMTSLPAGQVTIFRPAALLHAGTGRGVVHVLGQVLLCVFLFTSVASAFPVEPWVPDVTQKESQVDQNVFQTIDV